MAVSAGKLSAWLIRVAKAGSGTSLPGKIALSMAPNLLKTLGKQVRQRSVVVTGTNGKSTTAGLLSSWITAGGFKVVHNQLGANMAPGIAMALLRESSLSGKLSADYAVIEVDEASMPVVSKAVRQDLTLVTNLFRDQLDRYGELDTTARFIREGVEQSGGMLALNADDPMVTALGQHFPSERVIYYGVHAADYPIGLPADFPVGFPQEVTDCPFCQVGLIYTCMLYGHLGHYHCPECGFKRPKPWLEAQQIAVTATGSRIRLRMGETLLEPLNLELPGLFNAYNLLGAAAAGFWLELPSPLLQKSLASYQSIFGRAERRRIHGKSVLIQLIKNPIGATEVLKVVTADPKRQIAIFINDNYADGRDISWLWDAPFELLAETTQPILVSGHRAEDMALRLLYAGVPEECIRVEPELMKAFEQGLLQTAPDETLYLLPTYTALLQLSQALHSR